MLFSFFLLRPQEKGLEGTEVTNMNHGGLQRLNSSHFILESAQPKLTMSQQLNGKV